VGLIRQNRASALMMQPSTAFHGLVFVHPTIADRPPASIISYRRTLNKKGTAPILPPSAFSLKLKRPNSIQGHGRQADSDGRLQIRDMAVPWQLLTAWPYLTRVRLRVRTGVIHGLTGEKDCGCEIIEALRHASLIVEINAFGLVSCSCPDGASSITRPW